MARKERITIDRHSYGCWSVHDLFGLSKKVLVENNPCSRHITTVELSRVNTVPCRDRRGRPVRGIDMVRRYAEFSDARSHFLKHAVRNFILWRMSPLFGTDKHIPLDAAFYSYCEGRAEILDDLVDRTGHKNPHFFLDGSLISFPSWGSPSIIEIYRGYRSIYHGMLSPAYKVRGDGDFSLAMG